MDPADSEPILHAIACQEAVIAQHGLQLQDETLKSLSAQMGPQDAVMGQLGHQLRDVMETLKSISEQVDQMGSQNNLLDPHQSSFRLKLLSWP
ncbi:hypothetical protein SKAU_G00097500 [Synaphobranchus kaupii]|uniref:Uncharacterized protein n=1 Tax=Synaphobranchus kaupii TaxID=118154 RepID=A0A9Q1J619_SYNKA|nr:hypothetical protein SKAU_G00097500 [Synaphobranchus kaupii]